MPVMARVTGIGGVFIQSKKDGKALMKWYQDVLGMKPAEFGGTVFEWPEDTAEDKGATVWTTSEPDSKWFLPSTSPFMINYRVDDMAGMIARLAEHSVPVHEGPAYHENGVFLWVMDPEGNKVELWEPKNWDEKNKR